MVNLEDYMKQYLSSLQNKLNHKKEEVYELLLENINQLRNKNINKYLILKIKSFMLSSS